MGTDELALNDFTNLPIRCILAIILSKSAMSSSVCKVQLTKVSDTMSPHDYELWGRKVIPNSAYTLE